MASDRGAPLDLSSQCTPEKLEMFMDHYIKCDVLFLPANLVVDKREHRSKCDSVLRQLGRALSPGAPASAFQTRRLIYTYRCLYRNELRRLVRAAHGGGPAPSLEALLERVARSAPPWLRRAETKLQLLPDVMREELKSLPMLAKRLSERAHGAARPPPATRVLHAVRAAVRGARGDLVRAAELCGPQPNLALDVWSEVRRAAVRGLEAAVRGAGAGAGLTRGEWLAADLVLLYDQSYTAIDEIDLTQPRQAEDATRLLAAAPAGRPGRGAGRLAWLRARDGYCRGGGYLSLVTLQRRWHALQSLARESILAADRDRLAVPHDVCVGVARACPGVVTRALASWHECVRQGAVHVDEYEAEVGLTGETATCDGDVTECQPDAPRHDDVTHHHNDNEKDDDIILIEREIETIFLDESSDEEQKLVIDETLDEGQKQMLRTRGQALCHRLENDLEKQLDDIDQQSREKKIKSRKKFNAQRSILKKHFISTIDKVTREKETCQSSIDILEKLNPTSCKTKLIFEDEDDDDEKCPSDAIYPDNDNQPGFVNNIEEEPCAVDQNTSIEQPGDDDEKQALQKGIIKTYPVNKSAASYKNIPNETDASCSEKLVVEDNELKIDNDQNISPLHEHSYSQSADAEDFRPQTVPTALVIDPLNINNLQQYISVSKDDNLTGQDDIKSINIDMNEQTDSSESEQNESETKTKVTLDNIVPFINHVVECKSIKQSDSSVKESDSSDKVYVQSVSDDEGSDSDVEIVVDPKLLQSVHVPLVRCDHLLYSTCDSELDDNNLAAQSDADSHVNDPDYSGETSDSEVNDPTATSDDDVDYSEETSDSEDITEVNDPAVTSKVNDLAVTFEIDAGDKDLETKNNFSSNSVKNTSEVDSEAGNRTKRRRYETRNRNPDYDLTLKSLSSKFLSVRRNRMLLGECRPLCVLIERLPRDELARYVGARAERGAKRVRLADIEEVRRVNSCLLTAQVAPIAAGAPSGGDTAGALEAGALEAGAPGAGAGGAGMSEEALDDLLRRVSLRKREQQQQQAQQQQSEVTFSCSGGGQPAARHCCAARRHRCVNDARRRLLLRSRLPPRQDLPIHTIAHKSGACECCCKNLLEGERPEPRGRPEPRAGRQALRRMIARALRVTCGKPLKPKKKTKKSTPNKKSNGNKGQPPAASRPRPRRRAPPPPPASLDEGERLADDLAEWNRQKNLTTKYFHFPQERVNNTKPVQSIDNDPPKQSETDASKQEGNEISHLFHTEANVIKVLESSERTVVKLCKNTDGQTDGHKPTWKRRFDEALLANAPTKITLGIPLINSNITKPVAKITVKLTTDNNAPAQCVNQPEPKVNQPMNQSISTENRPDQSVQANRDQIQTAKKIMPVVYQFIPRIKEMKMKKDAIKYVKILPKTQASELPEVDGSTRTKQIKTSDVTQHEPLLKESSENNTNAFKDTFVKMCLPFKNDNQHATSVNKPIQTDNAIQPGGSEQTINQPVDQNDETKQDILKVDNANEDNKNILPLTLINVVQHTMGHGDPQSMDIDETVTSREKETGNSEISEVFSQEKEINNTGFAPKNEIQISEVKSEMKTEPNNTEPTWQTQMPVITSVTSQREAGSMDLLLEPKMPKKDVAHTVLAQRTMMPISKVTSETINKIDNTEPTWQTKMPVISSVTSQKRTASCDVIDKGGPIASKRTSHVIKQKSDNIGRVGISDVDDNVMDTPTSDEVVEDPNDVTCTDPSDAEIVSSYFTTVGSTVINRFSSNNVNTKNVVSSSTSDDDVTKESSDTHANDAIMPVKKTRARSSISNRETDRGISWTRRNEVRRRKKCVVMANKRMTLTNPNRVTTTRLSHVPIASPSNGTMASKRSEVTRVANTDKVTSMAPWNVAKGQNAVTAGQNDVTKGQNVANCVTQTSKNNAVVVGPNKDRPSVPGRLTLGPGQMLVLGHRKSGVEPKVGTLESNNTFGSNATTFALNVNALGPSATTFGPNVNTLGPNINTLGPNVNTLGPNATTFVPNVSTLGSNVTAFGPNVNTLGSNATTFGPNVNTLGPNVNILGPNATTFVPNVSTLGSNVTAFGPNVNTLGSNATTFGSNVTTLGSNVTAFGPNVSTLGTNATTFGPNITTLVSNVTAIGPNVSTLGPNPTTFGSNVATLGSNVTAIGPNVGTLGTNATTFGPNVNTLGSNATAVRPNEVTSEDVRPDGVTVGPDGVTVGPDGVTVVPDGVTVGPDGVVMVQLVPHIPAPRLTIQRCKNSRLGQLVTALPLTVSAFTRGRDPTNITMLRSDLEGPGAGPGAGGGAGGLSDEYLVVTEWEVPCARPAYWALGPANQARMILFDELHDQPEVYAQSKITVKSFARTDAANVLKTISLGGAAVSVDQLTSPSEMLLSAPDRLTMTKKLFQKLTDSPLVYAQVQTVVQQLEQVRQLALQGAPLHIVSCRSGEARPLTRDLTFAPVGLRCGHMTHLKDLVQRLNKQTLNNIVRGRPPDLTITILDSDDDEDK